MRGVMIEDRADLAAGFLISVKAMFDEDQVRAAPLGGDGWHRAFDAEFSRLIAGGGHHAAPARPADGHWLSA